MALSGYMHSFVCPVYSLFIHDYLKLKESHSKKLKKVMGNNNKSVLSETKLFSVIFLLILLNPGLIFSGHAQYNLVEINIDHPGIPVFGFLEFSSTSNHSVKHTFLYHDDCTMENTLNKPDEVIPNIRS